MDRDTSSPCAEQTTHATVCADLFCERAAAVSCAATAREVHSALVWWNAGSVDHGDAAVQALLLGGYLYAHICTRLLQRGLGRWVFRCMSRWWFCRWGFCRSFPSTRCGHGSDAPIHASCCCLYGLWGFLTFCSQRRGHSAKRGCPFAEVSYRLYALSNAGSLLALFGYPLVMEPLFPVTTQAKLWSLSSDSFCLWLLCAYLGLYANQPASCAAHIIVARFTATSRCRADAKQDRDRDVYPAANAVRDASVHHQSSVKTLR